MSDVALDMTMLLDRFVAAPNDGPGRGLGDDGEILHYRVSGGPWTYDDRPNLEATGIDKQVLDEAMQAGGAAVVGRRMYDATHGWGGSSPVGPCIVVTHRVDEQPDRASGFEFRGPSGGCGRPRPRDRRGQIRRDRRRRQHRPAGPAGRPGRRAAPAGRPRHPRRRAHLVRSARGASPSRAHTHPRVALRDAYHFRIRK
jgi:hypothetical protein